MKDENYKSKKKNVTIMSDDQRLNFKNSLYNMNLRLQENQILDLENSIKLFLINYNSHNIY